MDFEPVTEIAVSKTFTTVVLLTRSVQRAEAAILKGIEGGEGAGELFRNAVAAAAQAVCLWPEPSDLDVEKAFSILPAGLRPILHLPKYLRLCFVTRVLAGLSTVECAEMLGMDAARINGLTAAAMKELGRITATEEERNTPSELLRSEPNRLARAHSIS